VSSIRQLEKVFAWLVACDDHRSRGIDAPRSDAIAQGNLRSVRLAPSAMARVSRHLPSVRPQFLAGRQVEREGGEPLRHGTHSGTVSCTTGSLKPTALREPLCSPERPLPPKETGVEFAPVTRCNETVGAECAAARRRLRSRVRACAAATPISVWMYMVVMVGEFLQIEAGGGKRCGQGDYQFRATGTIGPSARMYESSPLRNPWCALTVGPSRDVQV